MIIFCAFGLSLASFFLSLWAVVHYSPAALKRNLLHDRLEIIKS